MEVHAQEERMLTHYIQILKLEKNTNAQQKHWQNTGKRKASQLLFAVQHKSGADRRIKNI